MPTIKINDIDCYYEIHGKGKPLVLIAGLGSDSQTWYPILAKLAKHFQMLIFDNRGVGKTKYREKKFTISTLAKDTLSLIDKLGIKRPHILGHSMGGYIAQEIAIAHPTKIDKLILASISAFTSERNKFLFNNMAHCLRDGVAYEIFLRAFFCWIFTPQYFNDKNNVDSAIKSLLEYPYPITFDGFKRQVEAINLFSSLNRINKLKTKTLILFGEKDILVTKKEIEELAAKMPNAEVASLKNAAHSIHTEKTEDFIKKIVGFLE